MSKKVCKEKADLLRNIWLIFISIAQDMFVPTGVELYLPLKANIQITANHKCIKIQIDFIDYNWETIHCHKFKIQEWFK